MKFCEKLKALRLERDMTQPEFAKLLGTSKQVISKYEKGENTPKITTVDHFSKVLNVPLAYLVNDDIESPSECEEISPAETDEIQMLLSKLSQKKKQQLVQYALFLLSQPDE